MRHRWRLRVTLEDTILLAYAAPPERVKPLLPSRLTADTLSGPEGPRAILTTLLGRAKIGRSGGRLRDLDAAVVVHGACVKREDTPSFFCFRLLLAPRSFGLPFRLVTPIVQPSTWSQADPSHAPGSAGAPGVSYRLQGRGARAQAEAYPLPDDETPDVPFGGRDSLVRFLSGRALVFFHLRGFSAGGPWLWKSPVEFPQPEYYPSAVTRIRSPLWTETGLLSAAEIEAPIASFVCPSIPTTWRIPRPDISI